MTSQEFVRELDARMAKYDLLCHPFCKAWSAGALTRDDLREYALDYYAHVRAFPSYLGAFALRLNESELRRAVLATCATSRGRGRLRPAREFTRQPVAGFRRRHGGRPPGSGTEQGRR